MIGIVVSIGFKEESLREMIKRVNQSSSSIVDSYHLFQANVMLSQTNETLKKVTSGIGYAQRIYNKRSRRLHSDVDFERVLNVNLGGTYRVMTRCIEVMATQSLTEDCQQRGVIVNTSSIAALEGQIGQIAYSASKGKCY